MMSVDPFLPMEYDDGTPVELYYKDRSDILGDLKRNQIRISATLAAIRSHTTHYPSAEYAGYFNASDGVFGGATVTEYRTIRNSFQGPEEIESWRL